MPFIGNKPSAVPLTSADIADGIITSAKIVDGTIVNADINASSAIALSKLSTTGTADATTFLRGDGAYTAVSSDFVLLATTDASSSSSVSFDGYFSATYKNYQVIVSNVKPVSDNVALRLRFRISNADVTSSNYVIAAATGQIDTLNNGSVGGGQNYNLGYIELNGNADNSASDQSHINFMIFDPLNTSSFKTIIGNKYFTNNITDNWYIRNFGASLRTSASSALSGFSFFYSSGNVSTGNFKLYGIK